MPLIGSFRSASGVVEDGKRGLNVGADGGCLAAAVGDGGGTIWINRIEIEQIRQRSTNLLEMV